MKAGVIGIGAALPEEIVTNADLVAHLDTSDEWIQRRTGIRERRHLNGSRTLADLAAEACTLALQATPAATPRTSTASWSAASPRTA